MFELIRTYQLNIMLGLGSMCAITALFAALMGNESKSKRLSLMLMEIYASLLLFADRFAYIYRGNTGTAGYYMVRISNFLVYLLTLGIIRAFNLYMANVLKSSGKIDLPPKRVKLTEILITAGEILLVIAQFFGLYYTFDEYNRYERGPAFILCYVIPLIASLIQLSLIIQYRKVLSRLVFYSLFLFSVVPILAAIVQVFTYGISLTNMTMVGMAILLFIFALIDMNHTVKRANEITINYLKEEQEATHRLFDQTATALASAIDAKDRHAQGHSARVAEYAKRLAQEKGLSEEDCDKVFYAALLHDVGKAGIPEGITTKKGKLTGEEYALVKQHTILGAEILSSITEYPHLSSVARYHHERFDGRGYPEGLKGEEIPEFARIVAVADAYDAMTSSRSFREAMPQQYAREEIIKGAGTQFDPEYAKYMQHMIDLDSEFNMREKIEARELKDQSEMLCEEYRSTVSAGVLMTKDIVNLHFHSVSTAAEGEIPGVPALVIFDSLDGCIHTEEQVIAAFNYFEFGEIWMDGHSVATRARSIRTDVIERDAVSADDFLGRTYDIELAKYDDHAMITIDDGSRIRKVIMALPDSSRYVYASLTGENCNITEIRVEPDGRQAGEGYIPRIADKVTYTNRLEGDVPNVQIDGYRTSCTAGVRIDGDMIITFHSMSLPTANLLWHCPFVVLFCSEDGKIKGPDYREFALIRFDGEYWESDNLVKNQIYTEKNREFKGWDEWKAVNRRGMECKVTFERTGNRLITTTENFGIYIRNTTTFSEGPQAVYAALSGDQVALTDIRIHRQ